VANAGTASSTHSGAAYRLLEERATSGPVTIADLSITVVIDLVVCCAANLETGRETDALRTASVFGNITPAKLVVTKGSDTIEWDIGLHFVERVPTDAKQPSAPDRANGNVSQWKESP